ncbi:MAG TPA: prepilin peptidase [bacterium]|nr:prepilin peptidase [bacterium]
MFLFYVFIFFFGLIIGSFLNCLIWREYKEETILGRSYCPNCKKQILWYDNIPLLSFILLKGRCRFCQQKISWQYPLVEFLTGTLFVASFYYNFYILDFSLVNLFLSLFFISFLIIVFVFDIRWFLIPVKLLLFGGIIIFLTNLYLGFSVGTILLSGVIGAGFFGIQYLISKGKWIGEGDIWLGGFLGIALADFSKILLLIFLTYLVGGVSAMLLIIFGRRKIGSKLPLGIFLSVAALITLFFGQELIDWYLGLILL